MCARLGRTCHRASSVDPYEGCIRYGRLCSSDLKRGKKKGDVQRRGLKQSWSRERQDLGRYRGKDNMKSIYRFICHLTRPSPHHFRLRNQQAIFTRTHCPVQTREQGHVRTAKGGHLGEKIDNCDYDATRISFGWT